MIGRTELELSTYQIRKAETRLAYQRTLVKKLRLDAQPGYVEVAEDLLKIMEKRLVDLHRRHLDLVLEQSAWLNPATSSSRSSNQTA